MNAISPQPSPEDEALERELRQFELVAPSARLKNRIRAAAADLGLESEAATASAPKNVVRFPNLQSWISSAAAMVALGFAIALWVQNPTEKPAGGVAGSAGAPNARVSPYTFTDQILVGHKNEGVVETADGTPMWSVRYDLLNRIESIDPETGEPRNEITPEERRFFYPVHHD